jgi:hypothetical protein
MSLLEGYRLFTGNYIYESDIPSEDKLELIRFLKEADADGIIDILSGKYVVEGLTEEDMEAVNTFLEGRAGVAMKAGKELAGKGVAAAGKGATAAVGGVKKGAAAVGRKVKKVLGYEELGAAKKGKSYYKKGSMLGKEPGKRYGRAVRGAIGRTALATGAVGAAGYGGVKAAKK